MSPSGRNLFWNIFVNDDKRKYGRHILAVWADFYRIQFWMVSYASYCGFDLIEESLT